MAEVAYNKNPNISDTVVFDLVTTDTAGVPTDVYKITQIIIYFLSRSRTPLNAGLVVQEINSNEYTSDFSSAPSQETFGDENTPAWLSTDPTNAFVTHVDTGVYQLKWVPELALEGDYIICYRWTVVPAGDEQFKSIPFYLLGDTAVTTAIPTHRTVPGKYETLVDRYLPNTYKTMLSSTDLTRDVIMPFNLAVAKGFTTLEDLANQIIDLYDANAVRDRLLPYLGNLFHLKLRSSDTQLWRRQIKTAVPLLKRKGTFGALVEAMSNAGIEVIRYSQLWQVKSQTLYTDGFAVTDETLLIDPPIFVLSNIAMLPIDPLNFELAIRFAETEEFMVLPSDYVSFETVDGKTIMTWEGDDRSFDPISLHVGDCLRVLYKIAPVTDQDAEDYIRTLPLFDLREECDPLPPKNWNVHVIEETDPMFALLCPVKHPFTPPVVFGRVRTEFAYSENAYFMEEYNGSLRDSTLPCDMDKEFQEPCSCCLSSKYYIDLAVTALSGERMQEAFEVLAEWTPFHAQPQQVGFVSAFEDVIVPPVETIEILIRMVPTDNIFGQQFSFNRLIPDVNDTNVLLRNQLATPVTTYSGSGSGRSSWAVFYSPGTMFSGMAVDQDAAVLDILGGSDAGRYAVTSSQDFLRIQQGSPDTTSEPLDSSEIPYRLANELYNEATASIYQDDLYNFSDQTLDVLSYPIQSGWLIVVTGLYAGNYTITSVNTDGSLSLASFPAAATGLTYTLKTPSLVSVFSGTTGEVEVQSRGRVESSLYAPEIGVRSTDVVEYSSTQYVISEVIGNDLYILGYSGGDVVGSANITVFRPLASGTGFLDYEGMVLNGTVPVVDYTLENNEFLANYAILIGSDYYQISDITGSDMTLVGTSLPWLLGGQPVGYSIVQYDKTSPIVTQNGVSFSRLDRRGNDEIVITTETASPMWATSYASNPDDQNDDVMVSEEIQISIEYR